MTCARVDWFLKDSGRRNKKFVEYCNNAKKGDTRNVEKADKRWVLVERKDGEPAKIEADW